MRARAASSRTKTATITAKISDLGYMAYGHCPYDVGRRSREMINVSRQSPPTSGALHVTHDPLRRSRPRGFFRRRVLELDHRTHRHAEVQREVSEQLTVVRLSRPDQS